MATRGQGQFASHWSPRTPLTGLTLTSSWGKTAGMASMRLSSARTAASTGEHPTGGQDMGGEVGGQEAVQLCPCYSVTSFWTQSTACLQTDFLCLEIICASMLSSRHELGGMRMGLYLLLSSLTPMAGRASPSVSHST